MKNIFLFSTRFRVFLTEIPLVFLLIISIVHNDNVDVLAKLYPLIIATSLLIVFIPFFFIRGVKISYDEVRTVGFFSTKEHCIINDSNTLRFTLLPKNRIKIELFGNSGDVVTYEWLKDEEARDINLFRARANGKESTLIRILRYFDIPDEDIENALNNNDFQSEYEEIEFSVKTENEVKEYSVKFKGKESSFNEGVLSKLPSSHILKGDETHAYRDPAVFLKDGIFHIFMTLVETEDDGNVYMYTVKTTTKDFVNFSKIKKLTVKDRSKNYSSPGNIFEFEGKYLMCLQSYPRENGEKFGNERARIFLSESRDLESWSEPEPILVKGDEPLENLGRMIDPYVIFDEKSKLWNCFFKQNGVSRSVSKDLIHFEFNGHINGGENVCILKAEDGYYMFHSPKNGIGVKFSKDLENWEDVGEPLTFGQTEWPWALGRLTAGAVVETVDNDGILYVMLFHGTGPEDESVIFDTHAGIGIAWTRDLKNWKWK